VTDTTKISGNAPAHRSQTIEFGANVPNRLQRAQFLPFGRPSAPDWGIVERAPSLRMLIAVHSLSGQRRSGEKVGSH
jgi:hypothetical protein